MDNNLIEQYNQNGFVVLERLLWPEECDELVMASYELADGLLKQIQKRIIFNTKNEVQLKHEYFMDSSDKIRAFIEESALDVAGNFTVPPKFSLNKIGHALHLLHPVFRCYTYCDRIKTKCKMLGLEQPAVVQSMVLFKNPGVSSEVQPHQDGTYLFAKPRPVIGFWIALEDATIENGCLWIVPGSHKSGVHRRLIRNSDQNSEDKVIYDQPIPYYPASGFRAVPVKKGSCIILHGHVVHKSYVNRTSNARPVYTFHVVETKENVYASKNWLQQGPEAPFLNMYTVTQFNFEKESKTTPKNEANQSTASTATASTSRQ